MAGGMRDQDYFAMKPGELPERAARTTTATRGAIDRWRSYSAKPTAAKHALTIRQTFARRSAEGLWEHCQERFPNHRFFAAGVAGGLPSRISFAASATSLRRCESSRAASSSRLNGLSGKCNARTGRTSDHRDSARTPTFGQKSPALDFRTLDPHSSGLPPMI